MNKYEERVAVRAKEMAKEWEENNITAKDPDYFDLTVIEFIPLARLSVLREAEAFKEGMLIVDTFLEWKHDDIASEQIERGLIPPQTQTTCKGECNSGIPSHTCPYKADVNDDNTLCACCDKCTSACSDNR